MMTPLQPLPPQNLAQTLTIRSSLISSAITTRNCKSKHHYKTLLQTRIPLTPLPAAATNTTTTDSGLCFREKLLYLQTLGVNPTKDLKNPNFRLTQLETLKSVETCLSSMGIERSAFGRIFGTNPKLLTCDPYSDIYPIFDFLLNDVNIPFHGIRKSITRCPRLLVSSVNDQLRPALHFLEKLGFVGDHAINCHTTLLLVSSVENTLMPKMRFFCDLGFDYKEVNMMVMRSPTLLTYSIQNNFRPKLEYFLEDMNRDLEELKRFPQYFSFSLEGKIKPRHQLLVEYGFSLSLPDMLKVSDKEFNVRLSEM